MIIDIKGHIVKIDNADLRIIQPYKWHISSTGYAVWRGTQDGKKQTIRMHRLLTSAPKGKIVDHINHDRLDNRRSNLRICTQTANMRNLRDQGKSYWFHKKNLNWVVEVNGKHVGCFSTEKEATKIVAYVRGGGVYKKPIATHCKYGHALSDAYHVKDRRSCRQCQQRRSKEYYRRRRLLSVEQNKAA